MLDDRQRVADQEHREIDGFRQCGDGGMTGQSEDLGASRVDGVEPGADPFRPGDQLTGDAGVGAALAVRGADHRHGLGPEEPVQVGHRSVQRTAADIPVDRVGALAPAVAVRFTHAVDGVWWLLPTGHDAGLPGVSGKGAVSRSKHRRRPLLCDGSITDT